MLHAILCRTLFVKHMNTEWDVLLAGAEGIFCPSTLKLKISSMVLLPFQNPACSSAEMLGIN